MIAVSAQAHCKLQNFRHGSGDDHDCFGEDRPGHGCGNGIGRAVSLALAEEGYLVVLTGRRIEPLDEVASRIAEQRGRASAIAADVSREDSTQALFARVSAEFGRLDLLFNNAGTSAPPVPLEELTLAQWQSVIDVNLTGAFLCTRRGDSGIMKNQTPRGGRIINNGSIAAHTPRPNSAPYAASKHAMTGLTKIHCARRPSVRHRLRTDRYRQRGHGDGARSFHVGALQANGSTKAEPLMDLAHVANAVRYMASLPLSANVLTLTVMATGMPYVGRG